MNRRRCGALRAVPWRVAGCLAAVAVLVAGCTSSSADGPTGSSGSGSSVAVSPSVADVSTSPSAHVASEGLASAPAAPSPTGTADSQDIAAEEAADRTAIEAQWVTFWEVYRQIARSPEADRPGLLQPVAIDPSFSAALRDAKTLSDQGLDTYGNVVHHLSWPIPVDNGQNATIADCMDQSNAGTFAVATNEKRSVGVAANNIRGVMNRGSDGIWRVSTLLYLTDQPC